MGINDEYSRDAYIGDQFAYDSDGSEDFDPYLDEESWQDMYSDELLYVWEKIQEYTYDNCLVLNENCKFPNFVDFVMDPSRWCPTMTPSGHAHRLWNKIKRVPILIDRILPENFYTWFDENIS
jgi:hypothetical protein